MDLDGVSTGLGEREAVVGGHAEPTASQGTIKPAPATGHLLVVNPITIRTDKPSPNQRKRKNSLRII